MGFWVVLFVIIVILGALDGGDSFGDTISKGSWCIIWCISTLVGIGAIALLFLALIVGAYHTFALIMRLLLYLSSALWVLMKSAIY